MLATTFKLGGFDILKIESTIYIERETETETDRYFENFQDQEQDKGKD
jgi:hypothetical protein